MKHESRFTLKQLCKALDDLGGLVSTPDGREILLGEMECAIRRNKVGGVLLDKVRLMYDYFRDPAEPVGPKAMIGAALLYLIIPTDLIPDWLAVIGLTDDIAAICIVWNQLKDVLMNYELRRMERAKGIIDEQRGGDGVWAGLLDRYRSRGMAARDGAGEKRNIPADAICGGASDR